MDYNICIRFINKWTLGKVKIKVRFLTITTVYSPITTVGPFALPTDKP